MITVQEVIAAVQAGDFNKTAVVTAEVWNEKYAANSKVCIYDGERQYKANSLEAAFNLYLAERQAREPAAADAELAAVLGAIPQE